MKIYNDREFPGILRYRDQFFPIPVPVLFSGTNFFRYRDRYFFPGPNFFGTGTGTFFRDQIFPVPVLFSGIKFFPYRYRYFFPGPNFSVTDTGTFSGTKFFRYQYRYFFPGQNFSGTGTGTIQNSRDRDVTLWFWVYVGRSLRSCRIWSAVEVQFSNWF